MNKIKEVIIGTNNQGKYEEICNLLPNKVKKYSPKEFKIITPEETGKTFEENSLIKASYFSKKTNLVCLSDDSGLEIDLLDGEPGIYSARWSGEKNNFNLAIEKVYEKMNMITKDWKNYNAARFVCSMTLYWTSGKSYISKGIIEGKISTNERGKNGFGYDPIFIPNGYFKTFGEMDFIAKMLIDHRCKAFTKMKKFFT